MGDNLKYSIQELRITGKGIFYGRPKPCFRQKIPAQLDAMVICFELQDPD